MPITAVLRDYKAENLEAARRLAAELGLTNVTIVAGRRLRPRLARGA